MDSFSEILSNIGVWFSTTGLQIVLILIVSLVAIKFIQFLLTRISSIFTTKQMGDKYKEQTDTFGSIIRRLIYIIILFVALMYILKILGVEIGAKVLAKGPKLFIILFLTLIAIKSVQFLSVRILTLFSKEQEDDEYKKRTDTLANVINHLLNVVIIVVAIMMILEEIGVDIGPILAAAGIIGLAVGFGAQNLVKDVINGFFILLEDQIRVGDVVDIAGKGGLVEKVNLKMTILRDLAGNVHFIPNGSIEVVTNMTKGFSRYVFNIGVAYREDVDEVIQIIKDIGAELQNDPEFAQDIVEPVEVFGLDEFADSALMIKARITTKPIKQWRVGREFNRRLKRIFDEKNIEIPFPHVTLYMGQDKGGQAPPVNINMQK